MSKFLVTGGAGYIGSHLVKLLVEQGHQVSVLDDLSTGHQEAVPPHVPLYKGTLADRKFVQETLNTGSFDAVFHFAAKSQVGESYHYPLHYFNCNVVNSLNLIEACVEAGIPKFVFSSTAAVYGEPKSLYLDETASTLPVNPYGLSKLMIEQMLAWAHTAHGMRSAVLRYFNAAGCDPDGVLGEDHSPETHLIPLCIDAALRRRPQLTIFGDDYPTTDGTAVRDYVHVCDLARAHVACLAALDSKSVVYNLGNGEGYSVREVIASVERVTGLVVPTVVGARRMGDPSHLIADSSRIQQELGWTPTMSDLDTLVESTFKWRLSHKDGYRT